MTNLGIRCALLLAISVAASACGTAEFTRKPTAPGQALIYVYRQSHMLGGMINGAVTLTGPNGFNRSFPLRNNKNVATIGPAGHYALTVAGAWGKIIANNQPIEAPDGSAIFVRCEFFDRCVIVPETQGGPEVADTKENVAGD